MRAQDVGQELAQAGYDGALSQQGGGRRRLFDGQYPQSKLRLTNTRRFASGALLLRYELGSR